MGEQSQNAEKHKLLVTSFSKLMKILRDNDVDDSGTINAGEFEKAMSQVRAKDVFKTRSNDL